MRVECVRSEISCRIELPAIKRMVLVKKAATDLTATSNKRAKTIADAPMLRACSFMVEERTNLPGEQINTGQQAAPERSTA